jgi:hypothetical protein
MHFVCVADFQTFCTLKALLHLLPAGGKDRLSASEAISRLVLFIPVSPSFLFKPGGIGIFSNLHVLFTLIRSQLTILLVIGYGKQQVLKRSSNPTDYPKR